MDNMNKLSINDQPTMLDWEAHLRAQQQQDHGPPEPPQQTNPYEGRVLGGAVPRDVPQLPPQAFTTSAQLLELVDKKVNVCLRDDKFIQGVMRSYDNYGNIVVKDSIEKIYSHAQKLFADVPRGMFIIRGENIAMIGEIDLDKDDDIPAGWTRAEVEVVFPLHKAESEARKEEQERKEANLARLGFVPEHGMEF
ncbi:hypothetical protein BU16DRAFT_525658 [Lophium mytilinum]|uniref:U6 snRNA-associated Sm-like protein LSm1 n=1 Tax=Lophium mytilinum TaxID=390894 RepID=A0A6A6R024_9PEZI|nr:hypothetical protein BU16DRAFT_525658 [Lophium mytilinum]